MLRALGPQPRHARLRRSRGGAHPRRRPSFTAACRVGSTRTSTPGASSRVQSSNGRGDTWPTTRLPRACAAAIASSRSRPTPGSSNVSNTGPITTGLPLVAASCSCHTRSSSRCSRSRSSARGAMVNRPGPGTGAERVGDGEQLVVVAHLAGQRGVAGSDVADDLIGREAERAEPEPLGDQLVHRRDLVGVRHPRCTRLRVPSPRRAPAGDRRGTRG